MAARGIVAYGGYIPRRRIERRVIVECNDWMNPALGALARGERSACRWDEDAVTMAVAAARDALATRDRAAIGAVHLASTTLPFADRQNAGLVSAALDLGDSTDTLDISGSLRGGTSALAMALSRGSTADSADTLVVASEKRAAQPGSVQELKFGHGAAALVIGDVEPVARCLGTRTVTRDFVDHYRGADQPFDYALEERWVRDEGYFTIVPDAVNALLAETGVTADALDHVVLPVGRRVASQLASKLGIGEAALADDLSDRCGDTGVAHPLVMLANVLERAATGQTILVVGFGQGADALLLETTGAIARARPQAGIGGWLGRGQPESRYTRYLSDSGLLSMAWGIRAERDNRTAQSVAWRRRREVNGFVGARCDACGTVQFPRGPVCVACREDSAMSDHPLAEHGGRVKSFTEDWLAHTPGPPLQYGHVALDGGASLLMEFTDFEPGGIEVGMPVALAFRIKDIDERRGYRRYFWKPVPADRGGPA